MKVHTSFDSENIRAHQVYVSTIAFCAWRGIQTANDFMQVVAECCCFAHNIEIVHLSAG